MIRLRYRFFVSAASLLLCSGLAVSCSSETGGQEFGDEAETFPIQAYGIQGSREKVAGTRAGAGKTTAAGAENVVSWFAPNGEEYIWPEGWNDPLGESASESPSGSSAGRKKTAYTYANSRLSVVWADGDQIGIKTRAHALGGTAEWTPMTIGKGVGQKVGTFMGLASTANGLQPTGRQEITAVYPFKADGNYDLSVQKGTVDSLGRYDIRTDQGLLKDGSADSLYLQTRISVLRICREFFNDAAVKVAGKGKTAITVTVQGAGFGSRLTGVCSSGEQVSTGAVSATVAVNSTTGLPDEDVYLAFLPVNSSVAQFTIDIQSGMDASTASKYNLYKSHFEVGKMYSLKSPGMDMAEKCIIFQDPLVETICVQRFDTNGDGCVSYREARSVTTLGTEFQSTEIRWFNELQEFTGLNTGYEAFLNCRLLEEVTLPIPLARSGNFTRMFNGCISLEWFSDNEMTVVPPEAFKGCTALKYLDFPKVETVLSNAFGYCAALESIDSKMFPELRTIDLSAFYKCTSLVEVNLSEVTTINDAAFKYCTSLTTVSLPEVTAINESVFENCTSLTTAYFPAAITIEKDAFHGCSSLVTADFPMVIDIGFQSFAGCYSLTTLNFPSATVIGIEAFMYCKSLTAVNFPAVITIERGAFDNCYLLGTVLFPSATKVGRPFVGCSMLTTADFPVVTEIEARLFQYCSRLSSLYLRNTAGVVKVNDDNGIINSSASKLGHLIPEYFIVYVPASLVSAYQAHDFWKQYNIQAIP